MRTSRRDFLARSAFIALGASIGTRSSDVQFTQAPKPRDVPWLGEILTVPPISPARSPTHPRLLIDVSTRTEWDRRRAELEQLWQEMLGSLEVSRTRPPAVRVLEEDRVDEVRRQLVRYESEPGVQTEAYVLSRHQSQGHRPGALVFHSTAPQSIRQPAGLADLPEKHFGLALARRGFVAFCPRNFLWPETTRMAADEETRRFRARHPHARGMAKMLFDGQVALDILAARPDVDPERLGCIGHSLGAKEALYLAAFDPRVKATVSSEGGVGISMSNWDAVWYLGPAAKEPGFAREHHELLALAAPRPFLLVGGDSADGAASWPFIAAAQPVYRLYGEPPRLGLLNHGKGHTVPPEMQSRLLEWLDTYV